jgi:hypothetical protein
MVTANMAEPMTRHDPRLAAWSTFLRAHAKVVRALESELQAEQDLALTDYDVLVQLAAADDRRLRMSELAGRLLLSRSGATRLVDRLRPPRPMGVPDRCRPSPAARGLAHPPARHRAALSRPLRHR